MAIFRVEKNKNYTVMSNYHLKEKGMSLRAKGLLSLMLSLPDDWDYSLNGLTAICGEGITIIRKVLKELEDFKYLIRKRVNGSNGKFEYEYIIYEKPYEDVPNTEIPYIDLPYAEKPYTVKRTQLNTNILNTKELNTKELINSSPAKAEQEPSDKINYKRIVDRLNELAGTNYRATSKSTKDLIKARINEGFKEDDLITVVEKMCYLWNKEPKGNEKDMRPYLRPSTLFRASNFENYLNMVVAEKKITTKDIASNMNFQGFLD